jgi:hypothetical protein
MEVFLFGSLNVQLNCLKVIKHIKTYEEENFTDSPRMLYYQ